LQNKIDLDAKNQDCRYRHYKLHDPMSNKVWCGDCKSYVEKIPKSTCECCGHKVAATKKHLRLKRLLNIARKQYEKEMVEWCVWNDDFYKVRTFKQKRDYKGNKMITIQVGHTVYELPMKYLVLSEKGLQDHQTMLEMVYGKIIIKGFEI
jgi:hypothetical protein